MDKLKELFKKFCNKEVILYLIFGVLATAVNLGVKYALLFTVLDASNGTQLQIAIIISWIVACLFAYVFGIFHNYTAKKQFMQVLINFY